MTLNPQAIKILEILEDGKKHCPIKWGYADGHGKRFTDINRFLASQGKMLAWAWCDCGRHTAKIKMRWIAPRTLQNEERVEIPILGTIEASTGRISLNSPTINPTKSAQNQLFAYQGVRKHE